MEINDYKVQLSVEENSKLVCSKFTVAFLSARNDIDYKSAFKRVINETLTTYKQLKKRELNKSEIIQVATNIALMLLKIYIEKPIIFDYSFELEREYTDNILLNFKIEKNDFRISKKRQW